jgi:transposase-like protein
LARRAQIVLAAAAGLENKQIAAQLGSDAGTVGKWRRRFAKRRLDGLYDEPRPGAPRRIGDDAIAETIRRTLEETPPDATHWSLRGMARASGYAPSKGCAHDALMHDRIDRRARGALAAPLRRQNTLHRSSAAGGSWAAALSELTRQGLIASPRCISGAR